jgi:hypothetical protein
MKTSLITKTHKRSAAVLVWLFFCIGLFGQTPSISGVTNAAIPALDAKQNGTMLPERSIASIFGTNLSTTTVAAKPPWPNILGGVEVHLATSTCFYSSCDVVASLLFVSPTQINFLTPDSGASFNPTVSDSCQYYKPTSYRIVLVQNGQRFDERGTILGGPANIVVDPCDNSDYSMVFQVGYDCLFLTSLDDPTSCGLSWNQGKDRYPLGAVTDALTGQLISPTNPVHQGQLITLWMTGLFGGVALNRKTGLFEQAHPLPINFQMLYDPVVTSQPVWAGESPQFVGLDQVNVVFPSCLALPTKFLATVERRTDAFMTFYKWDGTTVNLFIPVLVRIGDPDC